MAVCNLFNDLNNVSGNFMLFSQYVEDITQSYVNGNDYKVVPTKFVALNVDYDNIDIPNKTDLNYGIPKYMQNCFENACAYGHSVEHINWTPDVARNAFWNTLYNGKFIHISQYGSETSTAYYVPEVMYYGDISMHSYNEHKGMGYGEVYCYMPTDAEKMNCKVNVTIDDDKRQYVVNENNALEGYNDPIGNEYSKKYYYNKDFVMAFEDNNIEKLLSSNVTQYNINTIVVLYSVFRKLNDSWVPLYSEIPMGMYITGKFVDNKLTNTVTKYVSTSYGAGTSYGLRICTRFVATPAGAILSNNDFVVDNSSYTNICQLMTAMNENLSKMFEISKAAIDTTQSYKETLATIKNNRTNVPYVREVNGKDYWFVNGRLVSAVDKDDKSWCNHLSDDVIKKRLENLMDEDPNNDYTYIEDPNGCDCLENSVDDIVKYIKDNLDPNFTFEDTSNNQSGSNCNCNIDFAEEEEIIGSLNNA